MTKNSDITIQKYFSKGIINEKLSIYVFSLLQKSLIKINLKEEGVNLVYISRLHATVIGYQGKWNFNPQDTLTQVIEIFHTVIYGYTSLGMACHLITADSDRQALFSPRIFQYISHPETNEWILSTAFFANFQSKKEPSAVCSKQSFAVGFLRPAALEDQQGNKLNLV